LEFFQENTLHIEILREDDRLEKTYFYCPPFCKALDKETKLTFNREADRISVKSKVTSLVKSSNRLIQVMKHNSRLKNWLK
jgi:hypothetical protein